MSTFNAHHKISFLCLLLNLGMELTYLEVGHNINHKKMLSW